MKTVHSLSYPSSKCVSNSTLTQKMYTNLNVDPLLFMENVFSLTRMALMARQCPQMLLQTHNSNQIKSYSSQNSFYQHPHFALTCVFHYLVKLQIACVRIRVQKRFGRTAVSRYCASQFRVRRSICRSLLNGDVARKRVRLGNEAVCHG